MFIKERYLVVPPLTGIRLPAMVSVTFNKGKVVGELLHFSKTWRREYVIPFVHLEKQLEGEDVLRLLRLFLGGWNGNY